MTHPEFSKQLGLPYPEDTSDLLFSKTLSGFVTSPLIPGTIASKRNIYFTDSPNASNGTDSEDKNRCASDPEVQAAVAKLTAGE
jgi:hypothetical protein